MGAIARISKNIGYLVSGGVGAGLLGLAAAVFNARALGPELFGILAILQGFTTIVARFFSLDTWQPVVRFGADALRERNSGAFRDVVVLGICIDVIAASAAAVVAVVAAIWLLPMLGMTHLVNQYAPWVGASAVFSCVGTAVGILRLQDRFFVTSAIQITIALINLLASAVLFATAANLVYYVALLISLAFLSCVMTLAAATLTLKEIDFVWRGPFVRLSLVREFGRFSGWTWLMSTAASARQQSEVFILGSLAGPMATGIYSLSQKVAAPMNLLAQSARLAIFPELARTSRETDAVTTRTLLYSSALALVIGLLAIFIFYLISDKLLTILFGAAFASAGIPASVLLISHLLYAVGAIWLSVVIVRIGPAPIAASNIVALMVQVPVAVWLAPTLGALGAALANLGALLAWWGCLAVAIRTALKQR